MPSADKTVGLGQAAVLRGTGVLATLGLGSCVAVILHDEEAQVGGMVHVVLPSRSLARDRSNPARFAETAIPYLLAQVLETGATRTQIRARLVGGARMFGNLVAAGTMHMGQRNVIACRAALRASDIRIDAEAVGGEAGRSVWFDVATGRVTVRTVGHEPDEL